MIVTLFLVVAAIAPDSSRIAAARGDSSSAATPVRGSSSALPRPVLTLPETRVAGERPTPDARRRQPTGFVSDVRVGDTGHAFETVAELLSRTAAVRIQQYGGLGSFATVSLRGAPANQLAVYLDGVPLTTAAGSLYNFSDLPVTAVDRLEVYRGPSPLELGPVTPGGAINVVTLPPSTLRRLALKRGSFGTWEGRASAGARRGAWSALVHAGAQDSRGDFGYWDDNGTPLNPADDATSVRQNNHFESRMLHAAAKGLMPFGVAVVLRHSRFIKSQGVPGLGAVPALSTHLALDRSLSALELARPAAGWTPRLGVQLAADRARSRFSDRLGQLGGTATDTDDRFRGDQARVTGESPRLAGVFALEFSALLRDEREDLHDAASGRADPPESHRRTQGASLALRLEAWRGRVLVRAGRRWDRQRDALRWTSSLGVANAHDVVRDLNAPQLGARVRVVGTVDLKANWMRAQRTPEFLELFGNEGSIRGNPDLEPERSENWDAGGGASIERGAWRGSVEWAHYEQHARDLIAYVRNSASSVRATNFSRARIRGEELSGRIKMPRGVSLMGWVAWQGTLNQGDVAVWRGRRLPQRPERHSFAQLRWLGGRFDTSVDVEYLGEDYMDAANRMLVPARTLTGASVGVRSGFGARLVIEAKNLGDVRAADVAGFPLPGRSVFVSCEWDASHAHP